MDQSDRLKILLTERGYRVTAPRLEVFKALAITHDPMSVVELANQLKGTINRVTVYRVVETFEQVGVVNRVWTGFKSRVELSEVFSPHHHHFTCIKCSKTKGILSDRIESELERLEKDQNFQLTHHSIELKGICEDCLKSNTQLR